MSLITSGSQGSSMLMGGLDFEEMLMARKMQKWLVYDVNIYPYPPVDFPSLINDFILTL